MVAAGLSGGTENTFLAEPELKDLVEEEIGEAATKNGGQYLNSLVEEDEDRDLEENYLEQLRKNRFYYRLADFALALRQCLQNHNKLHNSHYQVRIGINMGPIVAGVIGKKKFAYDVWGGGWWTVKAHLVPRYRQRLQQNGIHRNGGQNSGHAGCVRGAQRRLCIRRSRHDQSERKGRVAHLLSTWTPRLFPPQ